MKGYRRGRARTETQRRRGKILEISLKTSGLNPAEAHELCNGLIVDLVEVIMDSRCTNCMLSFSFIIDNKRLKLYFDIYFVMV